MSKYYKVEDVIRAIEEMQNGYNGWSDTFDKAQIIGVIEELSTIEVSEDAISREWVLEKIDECYGETEYACNLAVALEREVKSAPSVLPQPKEGEWIYTSDQSGYVGNPVERCSVCGVEYEQAPFNYCPNCGAKMKGADDE